MTNLDYNQLNKRFYERSNRISIIINTSMYFIE
jgi:hypothetical protein